MLFELVKSIDGQHVMISFRQTRELNTHNDEEGEEEHEP